jgi:membrane protein
VRRLHALIDLARRSIARFAEMDGVDRAMGLAAQAFTAIFPLLIVVAAIFQGGDGGSLGDVLVERFRLSGDAAAAAHHAFPPSATVEDSVTGLSALILLITALSFTRAMQRMYERAWRLESRGVRDTPYGLAWLALLCAYGVLHTALSGHLGPVAGLLASLAGTLVLWLATPYVVLGRRLPWRRLVPQALLAAAGMAVLRAGSALYMPRAVSSASEQFGTIGLAFTLVSWLFSVALVLVATAAVGACLSEGAGARHSASVSPGARTRTSTSGASSAA